MPGSSIKIAHSSSPKARFPCQERVPTRYEVGALEGALRGDRNCHRCHQAVQVVEVEVLQNANIKRAYEVFKASANSPESRQSEVPMVFCACLRSRPVEVYTAMTTPFNSTRPGDELQGHPIEELHVLIQGGGERVDSPPWDHGGWVITCRVVDAVSWAVESPSHRHGAI